MKWWDDLEIRALGSVKGRIIRGAIIWVGTILFLALALTDWYGVITGEYGPLY